MMKVYVVRSVYVNDSEVYTNAFFKSETAAKAFIADYFTEETDLEEVWIDECNTSVEAYEMMKSRLIKCYE